MHLLTALPTIFLVLSPLLSAAQPLQTQEPLEQNLDLQDRSTDHTSPPLTCGTRTNLPMLEPRYNTSVSLVDDTCFHSWSASPCCPDGLDECWARICIHDEHWVSALSRPIIQPDAVSLLLHPYTPSIPLLLSLPISTVLAIYSTFEHKLTRPSYQTVLSSPPRPKTRNGITFRRRVCPSRG